MKNKMLKPKTGSFLLDETGIGVVEIILILVVLVILVMVFKDQLSQLVNSIFGSINTKSESIYR